MVPLRDKQVLSGKGVTCTDYSQDVLFHPRPKLLPLISGPTECALEDETYADGAETEVDCNRCVCACGNWVCTAMTCDGELCTSRRKKGRHGDNFRREITMREVRVGMVGKSAVAGSQQGNWGARDWLILVMSELSGGSIEGKALMPDALCWKVTPEVWNKRGSRPRTRSNVDKRLEW